MEETEMQSQQIVMVEASFSALHEAWRLPKDVKIVRIRQTWENELNKTATLLLESESFPVVPEGARIPIATIVMEGSGAQVYVGVDGGGVTCDNR